MLGKFDDFNYNPNEEIIGTFPNLEKLFEDWEYDASKGVTGTLTPLDEIFADWDQDDQVNAPKPAVKDNSTESAAEIFQRLYDGESADREESQTANVESPAERLQRIYDGKEAEGFKTIDVTHSISNPERSVAEKKVRSKFALSKLWESSAFQSAARLFAGATIVAGTMYAGSTDYLELIKVPKSTIQSQWIEI